MTDAQRLTEDPNPIRGRVWRALADVRSFGDPEPVLVHAGWNWDITTPDGPYRSISPTHPDAITVCTETVRQIRTPNDTCPF